MITDYFENCFTDNNDIQPFERVKVSDITKSDVVKIEVLSNKIKKLFSFDIPDEIKPVVCQSLLLFKNQPMFTDETINFSIINFCFDIITNIHKEFKVYGKTKQFLNIKINQGFNIKLVNSIDDANLVITDEIDNNNYQKGTNLLIKLDDFNESIEDLNNIINNFEYVSIYSPVRNLDVTYVYLENYGEKTNVDCKSYIVQKYNSMIEMKKLFIKECINVILKGKKYYSSYTFNYIDCQSCLNLYV